MRLGKFKWIKESAERKFTNRDASRTIFIEALEEYILDGDKLEIIVYYGVGGIGKTRLLKELWDKNVNADIPFDKKFISGFIDLGLKGLDEPIQSLLILRKQLEFACPLFDYSLASYWKITNPSRLDTDYRELVGEGLYTSIGDIMLGMLTDISPIEALLKGYNLGKEKYHRHTRKLKNKIIEINSFKSNPKELYDRLPYYLGLDIEYMLLHNKEYRFFLFLDAYEQYYGNGANALSNWLRELIGTIERGIVVVSGRERLMWSKVNIDWSSFVKQELIISLCDKDARTFLNSIPIKENDIIENIIKSSKGIPFYLDRLVDIYENKKEKGELLYHSDFDIYSVNIISRFMNHLNVNEREMIIYLSSIGVFNEELLLHIAKDLNISFSPIEIKRFIERSIIERVNKNYNLFRLHQLLKDQIFKELDDEIKVIAWNSISNFFSNRAIISFSKDEIFHFLFNLIDSVKGREKLNLLVINAILEMGLFLYDNGWWFELANSLRRKRYRKTDPIRPAIKFLIAISYRKSKSIAYGIKLLKEIKNNSQLLGEHRASFELELVYLKSINGNYEDTIPEFRRLYELSKTKNVTERFSIKAIEFYADILFLKGKFKESIQVLLSAKSKIDYTEQDKITENLRISGHVYRFNFMYKEAELYYLKGIEHANNNKSMLGKLATNMAETLCFYEPLNSLVWADQAIKINTNLHSKLELGKAYSAKAIANVLIGNLKEAENDINISLNYQKEIGYKSGVIFSNFAKFILSVKSQFDIKKIEKIYDDTLKQVNSLGVYSFLLLPMSMYLEHFQMIKKIKKDVDWLDFDYTHEIISDLLKNLTVK
ncbi:hypothetical protein [uncultured Psychroserpens sp.]|uniref:hypothetical protein n=1 Tax=uncultured Psychroserpens sp. TaxID=255436 RepID=UPI00262AC22A|nr:hypothetical protein [uncultured Psychroserpens sp.]